MKKMMCLISMAVLAGGIAFAQSAKVVVDSKGNPVGRYVRTNATTYTVIQQDTIDVPKAGLRVVTYSAEKDQGIVYCSNFDSYVNIRSIPSTSGKIVTRVRDKKV